MHVSRLIECCKHPQILRRALPQYVAWKRETLRNSFARAYLRARVEEHRHTERFGTEYGGWNLIPSGIDAGSVLYSFGVGEDVSFDLAVIDALGVVIHAFDPTPQSIKWVKKQHLPEAFIMHEYGVAAHDGTAVFSPPDDPAHVSHTILPRPATSDRAVALPVKGLATIMAELGHDHVDVVKLDIEGAEYDVIEDLRTASIRPSQILVEFHHRFSNVGLKKTRSAIRVLRAMGYRLFSVSNNNEDYGFILSNGTGNGSRLGP